MARQTQRNRSIASPWRRPSHRRMCDVIAAYPITPQTHIVEHLSDIVAEGELDAEFVPVESEHSAMSVCCGSAAVGARTFTSTSSQGLALMAEIFYITAAMRLPMVMALANRSLSGPLSIWNDHTDVMMVRDAGWIHIFVENGQESLRQRLLRLQDRRRPGGHAAAGHEPRRLHPHPHDRARRVSRMTRLIKKYLPEVQDEERPASGQPGVHGLFRACPRYTPRRRWAGSTALVNSYPRFSRHGRSGASSPAGTTTRWRPTGAMMPTTAS